VLTVALMFIGYKHAGGDSVVLAVGGLIAVFV
jgi:hypothetical protein